MTRYCVVGLGKTGLSCVRYLVREGADVCVVDTRDGSPFEKMIGDVPVHFGSLDHEFVTRADCLVVSPGVSIHLPEIQAAYARGAEILGDIELFARRVTDTPVIAITGSNGKSTVTAMLGEMAKAAGIKVCVAGNIGQPVLDTLDGAYELYILELSSFQLETTSSLKPIAATVLNVCEDHMDRYASFEDYVRAKKRIYHHATTAVINKEDPLTQADANTSKVIAFGLTPPDLETDFGFDGETLYQGKKPLMKAADLLLKGRHSVANALAAIALGRAAGIALSPMLNALKHFKGLAHRSAFVRELNEVTWINDSKGTNVGATLAAITGFASPDQKKLILLAGGQGKGADFSPLTDAVKAHVRELVVFGEDKALIQHALKDATSISTVNTLENAIQIALTLAKPGDTVLFSPACASFDQFPNFEKRGEAFVDLVDQLSR
mgnify:CR=1 FL=1|jgi:UDP-N-acetylmuramoylalanine--D-glutamate ligase